MAAKGSAIDGEHRKPLGSRIDRGCQSRWARPNDDDVVDAVCIEVTDEADAAGKLVLARVPE